MQLNVTNPFLSGTQVLKLQVDAHTSRALSGYHTKKDYSTQQSLEEQLHSLKSELEATKIREEYPVDGEIWRIVRKMEVDLKRSAETLYLWDPPALELDD